MGSIPTPSTKIMDRWLTDYNGYIFRYRKEGDTYKKIYQHDEIIEEVLGRKLKENECVHHIDWNTKNNSKSNLVCCTYKGHAEIHNPKVSYTTKPKMKYSIHKRVFHIDKETLEKLVWEMPTTHVAKLFGVSDKAIEKRCKLFNISKPPRGYWAKQNFAGVVE